MTPNPLLLLGLNEPLDHPITAYLKDPKDFEDKENYFFESCSKRITLLQFNLRLEAIESPRGTKTIDLANFEHSLKDSLVRLIPHIDCIITSRKKDIKVIRNTERTKYIDGIIHKRFNDVKKLNIGLSSDDKKLWNQAISNLRELLRRAKKSDTTSKIAYKNYALIQAAEQLQTFVSNYVWPSSAQMQASLNNTFGRNLNPATTSELMMSHLCQTPYLLPRLVQDKEKDRYYSVLEKMKSGETTEAKTITSGLKFISKG